MRFRDDIVTALSEHIVRLGLRTCPVCGGGSLQISRLPVILSVGGLHHEPDDARHDAEANIEYAVKVECAVCGHILLFNVEQFYTGDEPILYREPPTG